MVATQLCLASLIAILCFLNVAALRLFSTVRNRHVLPVLHNVLPTHVLPLVNVLKHRPECSLSLRHPEALDSLPLLYLHLRSVDSMCIVGASTVDTVQQVRNLFHMYYLSLVTKYHFHMIIQILDCHKAGAEFISTKNTVQNRFATCADRELPIYSGVQSLTDACNAVQWGASALKIFPSTDISPTQVAQMLASVRVAAELSNEPRKQQVPLRVFVSGGVPVSSVRDYIKAGATDIMVGLDVNELSMEEIEQKLQLYDNELCNYCDDMV